MAYPNQMPPKPTRSPMTFERDRVISVRFTEKEIVMLSAASDALGLKLSQYIRLAALEKARREGEKVGE